MSSTPFTLDELITAFKKVADPTDWEGPIYAVVDLDDVMVTIAAIKLFTANTVWNKNLSRDHERYGFGWEVTSPGRRDALRSGSFPHMTR
jgi:maltose-binding protein MalE